MSGDQPLDLLIIGGGASALGAAIGAIESGRVPTLLSLQSDWPHRLLKAAGSGKSGMQQKARFGSTEMYNYAETEDLKVDDEASLPLSSFPGGLTSVWGANIEVFPELELNAWGRGAADMRRAYNKILDVIPHVGAADSLDSRFPWPRDFDGATPASERFVAGIAKWKSLEEPSSTVGLARNASRPVGKGCIACGRCLEGCPEDAIFSAEQGFEALLAENPLRVIDGLALSLRLDADVIEVTYRDRATNQVRSVFARSVRLAAGAIASTIILSRSNLIPEEVTLDDTQVFYLPFVTHRRRSKSGSVYSLAQAFMTAPADVNELDDFHVSFYETDDSFRARATVLLGPVARLIPRMVFDHVLAGIGFLPPELSGKIHVMRIDGGVKVEVVGNPRSKGAVSHLRKVIRRDLRALGLRAVGPLTQIPGVGASYHVGKLSSRGQALVEPNTGRLLNTSADIRLVDGAGLPRLPVGPVTLTMMANAYRICSADG